MKLSLREPLSLVCSASCLSLSVLSRPSAAVRLERDFSVESATPNSSGTSIPRWAQINRIMA